MKEIERVKRCHKCKKVIVGKTFYFDPGQNYATLKFCSEACKKETERKHPRTLQMNWNTVLTDDDIIPQFKLRQYGQQTKDSITIGEYYKQMKKEKND